jgi:hypothetical protein
VLQNRASNSSVIEELHADDCFEKISKVFSQKTVDGRCAEQRRSMIMPAIRIRSPQAFR